MLNEWIPKSTEEWADKHEMFIIARDGRTVCGVGKAGNLRSK